MFNYNTIEKILASAVLSSIIFSTGPTIVLAQFLEVPTNEFNYGDQIIFGNSSPQVQSPYRDIRSQKDAEASKAAAEKLKQLHEQDKQQCAAELQGAGANEKIGAAIKEGLKQSMDKAMKETLPNALKETLRSKVGEKLGPNISNSIVNNMRNQASSQLERNMTQIFSRAEASGQPISREQFEQILNQQYRLVMQQSYQQGIYTGLKSGISSSIQQGVEEDLPTIMAQVVGKAQTQATKDFPSLFQRLLGTDIFGYLSDEIHSDDETFTSELLSPDSDLGDYIDGGTIEEMSDSLTSTFGTYSANQFSLIDTNSFIENILNALYSPPTSDGIIAPSSETLFSQMFNNSNIEENLTSSMGNDLDFAFNQIISDTQLGFASTLETSITGFTDASVDTLFASLQGNNADGAFDGIINQTVSGFSGSLNNALGGAENMVTGTLTGALDSAAGALTAPLTNSLTDALGPFGGALGGVMDDMTGAILDPIKGKIGDVVKDAFAPLTDKLSQFTSQITDKMTAVADKITGGAVSSIVGKIPGAGLIGGIFVPTQEQRGSLISQTKQVKKNTKNTDSNTKSIDKTTQSQLEIDIEACTKLKALERMNQAQEQRETVENPQLNAEAATAQETYKAEILDIKDRGYVIDPQGNEGPLYVRNINDIEGQVIAEARAIFYDDLNNSDDTFKTETSRVLKKADAQKSGSTITKEQFNKFAQGKITNTDEWWKTYIAVTDPFHPNDPLTSLNLQQGIQTGMEQKALTNTKENLAANQGYLPIRECKETTTDGKTCRRWETITPGIQVKETVAKVMTQRSDLYDNPEPGAVAPGNEPTVEELRTSQPVRTGGGGQASNAFDIGSILDMITGFLSRRNEDQGGGSLTMTSKKEGNILRISWQGTNLASCRTTDNWVGGGDLTSPRIIYTAGTPVPTAGSLPVTTPITFDLRFNLIPQGTNGFSVPIATSTSVSGSYQKKSISIPDQAKPGDTLSIEFWPFNSTIYSVQTQVSSTTTNRAGIAQAIAQAINNVIQNTSENEAQRAVLSKYMFDIRQIAEGTITIFPRNKYSLSCVDNKGVIKTGSVTIQ